MLVCLMQGCKINPELRKSGHVFECDKVVLQLQTELDIFFKALEIKKS